MSFDIGKTLAAVGIGQKRASCFVLESTKRRSSDGLFGGTGGGAFVAEATWLDYFYIHCCRIGSKKEEKEERLTSPRDAVLHMDSCYNNNR